MKKTLSFLLTLVMMVSITLGTGLVTQATTNKTKSEALSWAKSQLGKSLDYDGSYGAQCVDLIYYYYKYLGKTPQGGNARDYMSNALPSGWSRISVSSNTAIKGGDIAVYKTNYGNLTGEYGHVSIVASDTSGSTFACYQQNSNNRQYVTKDSGIKKDALKCVIRPDFKSEANVLSVYYNANDGDMILNDKYTVSDNWICNGSTKTKLVDKWTYNNTKIYGLYDANTFQLFRTGYYFLGWGTSSTGGKIFSDKDVTVRPSDLNSNISKGSCKVDLYAIWKPNTLSMTYNANGGQLNSSAYYLNSNGDIVQYSTGKILTQIWQYNESKEYGLYDGKTFGIIRKGYKFKGWSPNKSGTPAYSDQSSTLKAQYFNHDLYDKNTSQVMYASWEICTHNYSTEITVVPTCSTYGEIKYTCKDCGDTFTQILSQNSNHIWDKGKITKQPTFKVAGVKTYTCTECKGTKNVSVAKLVSPTVSKLTAGKKAFTVTYKKSATVAGYQVQYETNSKFTKGKKTLTVKGAKNTKKSVKKLTDKKKYYVRVRAYKTINGKKVYSPWSKAKAVTTKK